MKRLFALLLPFSTVACIQEVPLSTEDTSTGDAFTSTDASGDASNTADGRVTPAPRVVVTPDTLVFGVASIAIEYAKRVTVSNTGDATATIKSIAIEDATTNDIWALRNSDGVAIDADNGGAYLPLELGPGESFELDVIFESTGGTASAATLVVTVDGGNPTRASLVANAPGAADLDAFCDPNILTVESAAFGALAVAPWGKAYVVGAEGGTQVPWRLGEIDLEAPAIQPVIPVEDGGFAGMQRDWIAIDGDVVSVYEFYPAGQVHAFNRLNNNVSSYTPDVTPGSGTYISRRGTTTWGVRIGQGPDDICGNVCIVRTPDNGAMEVVLDDDGDGYKIHTNHVSWFGDHVYFMSYNNVVDGAAGASAFRRMNLDTGDVELISVLDPTGSNGWVQTPVVGVDGRLYWIRVSHDGQNNRPAEAAIDAYDPATGDLTSGYVPNLGASPQNLKRTASGTFVWVDAAGVRSAPATGGAAEVRRAVIGGEYEWIFTDVIGENVWYAQTAQTNGSAVATLGCVPAL